MNALDNLYRLPEGIASEDYVVATYYFETPLDLYEAADHLAAEQSTGTWQRVGEETEAVREKHGAKVIGLCPLPFKAAERHLPSGVVRAEFGAGRAEQYNCGMVRLAFPWINFGAKLANLLSAVAGNLYEMGPFTAIKLMDLEFPGSFTQHFQGPKFGIGGTREALGCFGRPLVGAIIKPCVGLSPAGLAELAYQGSKGGLDFIKDDELIADTEYNSIKNRVQAVMAALKCSYEETGQRTMYAFNITDRVDRIRDLHDIVVENGGNCVMINVATAGYSSMRVLSEYTQVPIHCHRDFAPSYTRSPYIGMSFGVFTKICRLAGADQLHVGAICGKLYESDEEVMSNTRGCLLPFAHLKPSLPVSSGGQWAGTAPINYRKFGTVDFIHLSGGGIYAHPDGAEAGARSVRQAWEAVLGGIPVEEYAKSHPELQKAMEHLGGVIY